MYILVLIIMTITLLGVLALINEGRRPHKKEAGRSKPREPEKWPRLAVLVPADGDEPNQEAILTALLDQDYPDAEVLVITRDEHEPAVRRLAELQKKYPHVRHVVSGPASACGQKNHNLLAGYRAASPDREVLLFCDATRKARPNFFSSLIRPLALSEALVTSGYYQVIPGDNKLWTWGHAFTAMSLFMSRGIKMLMQPWGGGTAIRKSTFEALKVDRLWAENVVDDVSLAALLFKARVGTIFVPEACTEAALEGETLGGWIDWSVRQYLYLKFCFPVTWAAGGIYCFTITGMTLFALVQCLILAPLGLTSVAWAAPSAAYLLLMSFLFHWLRTFHSAPGPWLKWQLAGFTSFLTAALAYLKTVFAKEIEWRGISYRVTWSGKVLDIIRPERSLI